MKTRINQLIATQTSQHNTLDHVVSILNVTRYYTQVNRHSINNLIDAICTTSQDINNLYNLATCLAASINFNQMILHIRSVFANLWDSLHYLQTVSTHTMEYIDTATSNILSPHVLPVVGLQKMLQHIVDTLPPTLHLPISTEDTLHFYRYLCTHVFDRKQTIFITNWHTHTGQSLQDHHTPCLYPGYSPWKLLSLQWYQHQILWSNQRCHNGNETLYCTISDMSTSQWTVLPHLYTFPTSS